MYDNYDCLSLCFYFDRKPYDIEDLPLDRMGYQEIWDVLACLGPAVVHGYMWSIEDGPDTSKQPHSLRLGEHDGLTRLFPDLDIAIGGGFYGESSKGTSDMGFGQSPCSAWCGHSTPARVDLTLSGYWLERVGAPSKILELILQVVAVLDRYKPVYGFVDYSKQDPSSLSASFGMSSDLALSDWVTNSRWYQTEWRSGKVRSVHWGNYLCNSALQKAGTPGLPQLFRERSTTPNGTKTGAVFELLSGAFFCMSPTPFLTLQNYDQFGFNVDYFVGDLVSR